MLSLVHVLDLAGPAADGTQSPPERPELPRNATGKILRAALREPFWAGRARLVS